MTAICVCAPKRAIAPTSKRESPRFNAAPISHYRSPSRSWWRPMLPSRRRCRPMPTRRRCLSGRCAAPRRAAPRPAAPRCAAARQACAKPAQARHRARVRGVGHRHSIVGIGRISLGARRQGFGRAAGRGFGNGMELSLPIRIFRRTVVGNRGGRALLDRRSARGLRRCRDRGRATPDRREHASRSGSPMGFLARTLLLLSAGCSFSPQLDGTYVCGADDSCPPALHCNLDRRCVGAFSAVDLSAAPTCHASSRTWLQSASTWPRSTRPASISRTWIVACDPARDLSRMDLSHVDLSHVDLAQRRPGLRPEEVQPGSMR